MKRIVAIVTGRDEFPLDMLRYDSCFPATEEDAALMERTYRHPEDKFEIKVARYVDEDTGKPWNKDRWERKFHCTLVEVE